MSRFAAVVLAAGLGSRYRASGGAAPTKLVARLGGIPLVRHVVEAARDGGADPVIVVTGHARGEVEAALAGLPVRFAHNTAFAEGLAGSLRTGVALVPADVARAMILLGDMPMVSPTLVRRLASAAGTIPAPDAVVPTVAGRRGNPVILSRRLFPAIGRLEGDAGARHLLTQPGVSVLEIAVDGAAAALDVDEAADLARAVEMTASEPKSTSREGGRRDAVSGSA